MRQVTRYTRSAVIIVVTNPVDLVTYYGQTHFSTRPKRSSAPAPC